MSEIKKRILQYLESVHVTEYRYCAKVNMSHGILRRKTGISEENIIKFIQEYPEVDINWLITGSKKGEPTSIKEKKEVPDIHKIKGMKLPSRNATKLEAIHNEMKEMLIEIKNLKEDINNQKIIIDSFSKHTNSKEKKSPFKKSIFNVKKEREVLIEIRSLKNEFTNQKSVINSIEKKLNHSGIGNTPYKRVNKSEAMKNVHAHLESKIDKKNTKVARGSKSQ
jgi:hypothetical protein